MNIEIELAIVEQYLREESARRTELLHWIADELERAFA